MLDAPYDRDRDSTYFTMAATGRRPLAGYRDVPLAVVPVRPLFALHFKVFANVRKGPWGSPGPNFTNQNDRNQEQGRCQWADSEVAAVKPARHLWMTRNLGRVPFRLFLSR